MIYLDNPNVDVTLSGCSYSNIYATNEGGLIEGKRLHSLTISGCPLMKNIKAGLRGSFFYSTFSTFDFTLSTCNI